MRENEWSKPCKPGGQGRSFQKRTLKLNVERYQVKVEGEVVASHVKRTASIKAKR